ncbi:hypothetical protein DFJ73DRAFT_859555 [Zopfochytrium polystomum]|nr:hypothetical protein DFJ73DRAFT_859555 [Zopfochytrium polystomum]
MLQNVSTTIAVFSNPTCLSGAAASDNNLSGLSLIASVNLNACLPSPCTADTNGTISVETLCNVADDRAYASREFGESPSFLGISTFADFRCSFLLTTVFVRADGLCHSVGDGSYRATFSNVTSGAAPSLKFWPGSGACQGIVPGYDGFQLDRFVASGSRKWGSERSRSSTDRRLSQVSCQEEGKRAVVTAGVVVALAAISLLFRCFDLFTL